VDGDDKGHVNLWPYTTLIMAIDLPILKIKAHHGIPDLQQVWKEKKKHPSDSSLSEAAETAVRSGL
jgi:hypothetical protein